MRLAYLTTKAAYDLANGREVEGETDDPCCEKRVYTADEEVIDQEKLASYDESNAVAPEGWKLPPQG